MEKLLRRRQVEEVTGFGRAYIYQLVKEGKFPRPVRVGQRAVRWRAAAVEGWIEEKLTEAGR